MRYRKIMIGIVAVAAAITSAVVSASPALAFTNIITSTNNPGTPSTTPAGTVQNFTAVSTTTATLTDVRSGAQLVCTIGRVSIAGTFVKGAKSTATGVATIPVGGATFGSATWSGSQDGTNGTFTSGSTPCTASAGSVAVAVQQCRAWNLDVTGASSGSAHPPTIPTAGQITPGQINNVCARVYLRNSATSACHFDVSGITDPKQSNPSTVADGYVNGTYTNTQPKGTLTVNTNSPSLKAYNQTNPSTGCVGGLIQKDDTFTFTATVSVTVTATPGKSDALWINS